MKRTAALLLLLLASVVGATASRRTVYYVEDIPQCWHRPTVDRKHTWVNRRIGPATAIKGIPEADCVEKWVYETCSFCLSTFITMVYHDGPKCPKQPPKGTCAP